MKHMHEYVQRVQHALRLDKLPPIVRKVLVFVVGGVFLAAGIVMIITPGPAFVFIPLGLLLLATEFKWAERAADKLIGAFESLRCRWRERKNRRARHA